MLLGRQAVVADPNSLFSWKRERFSSRNPIPMGPSGSTKAQLRCGQRRGREEVRQESESHKIRHTGGRENAEENFLASYNLHTNEAEEIDPNA